MASWSDLLPPLLVAAALLYLPGGLVAAAARLPVRVAVVLAPALSVAIIAGAGVIAPMTGLTWGPGPVAGMAFVMILAALAVDRASTLLASRRSRAVPDGGPPDEPAAPPDERACSEPAAPSGKAVPAEAADSAEEAGGSAPVPARGGGWGARGRAAARSLVSGHGPLADLGLWALSAALMTVICARFINAPDAFSQTYDTIFHLNAVRWILDTGSASSLSFDMVTSRGAIYPLGWHTLVTLTMRLSGATSIPLVTNAVMFAVAGLVWTSGVITLTGALTADRRAGRVATAVLASAAPAFPLLGLFWGILYPMFLATALLPGILLTAMAAVAAGTPLPRRVMLWLAAGAGCAGMALAHPSLLVVAALVAVAAAAARTASLALAVRTRRDACRAALACVLTVLLAAVSWSFAPVLRASKDVSRWPPHTSVAGGIGEAVMSAPELTAIVWPLALLVIIGFLAAWRRPSLWWVAVTHTVVCALYVLTVSRDFDQTRYDLTGFWYSDAYRLAGFMMVTALPLAGVGACALADAVVRALPRAARTAGTGRGLRVGLTVVVIAVLSWQGPGSAAMSDNLKRFEATFLVTDNSQSLTTDELAVVNRLPELLGPDDVVLVDPWRGGSLAYALTGVNTLPRHLTSYYDTSPSLEVLMYYLDEVQTNPVVCPAVEKLGVDYVLDFKGRTILNGPKAPGMSAIVPRNGFQPVLRIGNATLYRITACG